MVLWLRKKGSLRATSLYFCANQGRRAPCPLRAGEGVPCSSVTQDARPTDINSLRSHDFRGRGTLWLSMPLLGRAAHDSRPRVITEGYEAAPEFKGGGGFSQQTATAGAHEET